MNRNTSHWLSIFWLHSWKFNFWEGYWELGPVSTQIWDCQNIFFNFLRSSILCCFATCEATVIPSLLNYISSFAVLVEIALLENHYRVPNYYSHDCLKIFILLSVLPIMIRVQRKMLIPLKKLSIIRKQPVRKAEGFLKSYFDLSQKCKILHTQI